MEFIQADWSDLTEYVIKQRRKETHGRTGQIRQYGAINIKQKQLLPQFQKHVPIEHSYTSSNTFQDIHFLERILFLHILTTQKHHTTALNFAHTTKLHYLCTRNKSFTKQNNNEHFYKLCDYVHTFTYIWQLP